MWLVLFVSGCTTVAGFGARPSKQTIADTVLAIDEAINALNGSSVKTPREILEVFSPNFLAAVGFCQV